MEKELQITQYKNIDKMGVTYIFCPWISDRSIVQTINIPTITAKQKINNHKDPLMAFWWFCFVCLFVFCLACTCTQDSEVINWSYHISVFPSLTQTIHHQSGGHVCLTFCIATPFHVQQKDKLVR